MKNITFSVLCLSILICFSNIDTFSQKLPPRQMEKLSRGLVAVRFDTNKVWISWRLFGTDSEKIAFNLYRETDGK